MSEIAFAYLLLGLGIVFVLVLVFLLSTRSARRAAAAPKPPRGVHLPNPSWLPVIMSLGAGLIGAGLAFKPETALFNWYLLIPGLVLFVIGSFGWVRASGREWHQVERGGHHDDASGH
jgi:hypothetical protein